MKVSENMKSPLNKQIAVDQIGYSLSTAKYAVSSVCITNEFLVVEEATDEVVYVGTPSEKAFDKATQSDIYYLDFSALNKEGRFYIATELGRSYSFDIKAVAYKELADAAVKALYFQRCGMDLEEKYAGKFTHRACHNIPAYLLTDESVIVNDVSGGWHDAGDYGKYITPANQTVFNMMCAYEFAKSGISEDLNIPESGNGLHDILNEAKYELDWMLKMQREDGGVYHKVTTVEFAGNVMPDDDNHEVQALSPVTITATAGFAAAMAHASRTYKPFYPEWAQKCLDAAVKAFDYAIEHYPEHKPFSNVPPCVTGEYGDECCFDEIYWACAELFKTTGDKRYENALAEFYDKDFCKTSYGAYHQGGHGSFIYCLCDNADERLKGKVMNDIITDADLYYDIINVDGYKPALYWGDEQNEDEYYWGSNAVLTNHLSNMIAAAVLLKTDKYDDAIRKSLHYMFGVNCISKCFVTGFGTDSVKNPHHRPSMFDNIEEPIPGLISGGPNERKWQRPQGMDDKPKPACYLDWEWNWTSNEITIYWNSSCFYALSYVNSLDKKKA